MPIYTPCCKYVSTEYRQHRRSSGPSGALGWRSVREIERLHKEELGTHFGWLSPIELTGLTVIPTNHSGGSDLGRTRGTGGVSRDCFSREWKYYPPSRPPLDPKVFKWQNEENRGGSQKPPKSPQKPNRPLTTAVITCLSSTNLPAVASDNYYPNKDRETPSAIDTILNQFLLWYQHQTRSGKTISQSEDRFLSWSPRGVEFDRVGGLIGPSVARSVGHGLLHGNLPAVGIGLVNNDGRAFGGQESCGREGN